MKTVNNIRDSFFGFFQQNGHKIVPSSSLVPDNDATLMFTNAGMVQFKNVFTGLEKRNYTKAVTAQKCVRAGGKHNDLDNVGYTARHHTFFEMLGNFSFGDYFKEEAIVYAWEFLTQVLALPNDKLLVTVYHDDLEAKALWKKVAGFADEKIISIKTSDNFWSMGDTGPCGPCSEIFYDHGAHIRGGPPGSPDEDGDRFVEIWNLVFMQYDQISVEQRVSLPKPSIDTGAGIERLAAVLQGVCNNYDIDLFKNLISAVEDVSSIKAIGKKAVSHRVIADHLRAMAFLIADGVSPSNEGRGYVLRRIMRRAMRHAHLLGAKEPMIWQLVPVLVQEMGAAYTQLSIEEKIIQETIKDEEERFGKTLHRGLELLSQEISLLSADQKLSGETAFKLYDTYGFPLDLTIDILRGSNHQLEQASFDKAMQEQQARARANWAGSGDIATDAIWFSLKNEMGDSNFVGYEQVQSEAQIKAIVKDMATFSTIKEGEVCFLLLDKTPFYAESGGQIGDRGIIQGRDFTIEILDVQKKLNTLYVHKAKVKKGVVKIGAFGQAIVDRALRKLISANHSATHLLHKALRQRLGNTVTQKGSNVMWDRLRFDFAYNKALTMQDLAIIELEVNQQIILNNPVLISLMSKGEAVEAGAMALFGEKYGDLVRLVSMGSHDMENKFWSMELCGGTHVKFTGDIGVFKIIAQSSVSSGIRRIEAVTGLQALSYINERLQQLDNTAKLLKTTMLSVVPRVENLLDEGKNLKKQVAIATALQITDGVNTSHIEQIGNIEILFDILHNIATRELKPLVDKARKIVKTGIIAFITVDEENKASAIVGISKDLLDSYNAVDLVKILAKELGGKSGGGRKDLAQAGGHLGQNAQQALHSLKEYLRVSLDV